MVFCEFKVSDVEKLSPFLKSSGEMTCESAFANLLVWQNLYGNSYATENGILYLKSNYKHGDLFNVPFGDVKKGFEKIREYSGKEYPTFWAQDGERFNKFMAIFGQYYEVNEMRDDFDYLYLRQDLATLSGKKYHSKRNHISSFKKQYGYTFSPICEENISDIKICAQKWYEENADFMDASMQNEKKAIEILLDNYKALGIMGGQISVENETVAFTLASAINENVADIHIEKALSLYSTAYSVINYEFAKNILGNFKYINREDDMGIDGLRRAKLSYHPERLIKKYLLKKREDL